MKKFILSFVALLAVGTIAKATNGIVDGQLPSAMTSETNPGICKDLTFTGFNTWGTDEIPIYDDCKTNVYLTLTRPGEYDFHTFIYEINDASGYATMLANNNGWGVYTMTNSDPYIYTTIPGNYVISVYKTTDGAKFTVTSDKKGESSTAWTGTEYISSTFPDQEWYVVPPTGDNGAGGTYSGVISAFHMGGEACSYSINEVSFTAVDDANVEPKDYERTYTQSVTMTESWWSQKDLTVDQMFGLIDPAYATSITISAQLADGTGYDGYAFMLAYNGYDPEKEVAGEWIYAYPDENGVLEFDVSYLDFDAYCTSICYSVAGTADVVITWTVTGTRINPDYDAKNSIYDPNAIEEIKVDAVEVVEVARYNLAGQKIAGAQKGINIIVYSDGSSKKVLEK